MIAARYVVRTLLVHILTVLLALLGLIAIFNFIEQLDDVGVGTFSVSSAILHSLLLLPTWVLSFAPVATFLGALSGLGRLHQDSELTVLRAAGWSVARLASLALTAGVIVSLGAVLIGEFLGTGLAQTAVRMKAELKFGPGVAPTNSAWWTRDGPRLVGLDRRSGFPAVTVLELDARGDVAALGEADTVTVGRNAEVAYERYRETRFDAERSSTRASPRQVEQSAAVKSLLNVSQGTQRFASMRQLNAQREQLLRAKLGNTAAVYEINERLAQTVLGPLLAILALPIVLGLLRSAKQGARLVLGLVIGFGLTILQDVASSVVSVFGAPPALLAWSPILLTLLVLLYMLRSLQPPARQAGSA